MADSVEKVFKEEKKVCTGACGPNCCKGDPNKKCCGGHGHHTEEKKEKEILPMS